MRRLFTSLSALAVLVLGAVVLTEARPLVQDEESIEEEVEELAPRRIFLARHAETKDEGGDRELNDAGQRRARDLARLLSSTGVTHLFSSSYARSQQTIAPLAEATGLSVKLVTPWPVETQLEELSKLPPGSVAVVVGHSNTTPALARALTTYELKAMVENKVYGPMFEEDAHDRLLMIQVPGDSLEGTLTEFRFGAGPPAPAVVESLSH